MSPTRHLTFANTCSALALVVALGTGTAYAAATVRSADIVNGQVKTVDLGASSVTTGKIAPGGVTRTDLQAGSVSGEKVQDDGLTGADLAAGSLGQSDLAADSVGASEVVANAIDGDELLDGSVTADDLGASSVAASELADNAVEGSNVVNGSLTASDLAGGVATGNVSFQAGAVADGRCEGYSIGIGGGAEAGDAVVVSARAAMQEGVFLQGTQVTSPSTAVVLVCNLSGGAMNAITNLPIRLITFR